MTDDDFPPVNETTTTADPGEADPGRWAVDVVLSDGGTVHVRPIRPDDGERLRAFHAGLSADAIYYRFFTPMPELSDKLLERLVNVDYRRRLALVAEVAGAFVAVARYEGLEEGSAEVAFVVDDRHQRRGLGSLLLEHLAVIARTNGFHTFVAQTLPDNTGMLRVFRSAGYEVARRFDDGVVEVRFAIEPTALSQATVEERDRRAVAASVRRLLHPASVVVIGADHPAGAQVLANLRAADYLGPIDTFGAPAGAGPDAAPYPVADLAIVAVDPALLEATIECCGRSGIGAILVLSDGDGGVVEVARRFGLRMIGPGSVGIVNTDPALCLNASTTPTLAAAGPLGFMTQSGALGAVVLAESHERAVGLSCFVDAGDKLDISGNDLLQYFELDPATEVIGLYLESFGNPRRFTRIARRVARRKPVVVVAAGRRRSGPRHDSHVAALAAPAAVAQAVFAAIGVTAVATLDEVLGVAAAFATQPLPSGRRVAIVGTLRGPGTLAADAADAAGLEVVVTHDVPTAASAAELAAAVGAAASDHAVDAVLVVHAGAPGSEPDEVLAALDRIAANAAVPILASLLGPYGRPPTGRGGVPVYRAPEAAARALAALAGRAAWLRSSATALDTDSEDPSAPGGDLPLDELRAIVEGYLGRCPAGGWLEPSPAQRFAALAGLPMLDGELVADAVSAGAAADRLGYPVAVKAASAEIADLQEAGGLALALRDREAVVAAASAILARLGERAGGLVVQPMLPPGTDLIAGITTDAAFGPLVVFGLGGMRGELLLDRVVHPLPVTPGDAARMVRGLRTSPLLFGFRGAPRPDTDALEALLVRLGRLAEEIPEIAELDLGPIIAGAGSSAAVELRIRLRRYDPHPERQLRSLTME